MRLLTITMSLLLISSLSWAQQTKDNKLSPIGGFSGRYSLVQGRANRIMGVYGGAEYLEKYKGWLGYYWMGKPVVEQYSDPALPGLGYVSKLEGRMRYLGLGGEYTFKLSDKWRLSTPVQFGLGKVTEELTSLIDHKLISSEKTLVLPFEFGINGQYYIFPWLGAKAGFGTRIVAGKDMSATYSGPYTTAGILLFFGPLYRKLPPNLQIISSNPLRTPPASN